MKKITLTFCGLIFISAFVSITPLNTLKRTLRNYQEALDVKIVIHITFQR